jgi:uncharacterized heparinase superfamily protein
MARIGLSERVRVAAVRAGGLRRLAASRVLESPLLHWRAGSDALRHQLIEPPDLRSRDPSVWTELEAGHLGLAGQAAILHGRSPFDQPQMSPAWTRELHSFSWLRHLAAADDLAAHHAGRDALVRWMRDRSFRRGLPAEPPVRARRILSILAHAPILLEGGEPADLAIVGRGLSREIASLTRTWREAQEPRGRLLALTALVEANLVLGGRERAFESAQRAWLFEIDRQILGDGGHVSRNPSALMELLLDWLPLRSCFDALKRTPPEALLLAIPRMLTMLRWLKLGDGTLAHFNGASVAHPAELATLSAYDDRALPAWGVAPASKYARLSAGASVVLVDAGGPPPLMNSGEAHAGCLSFEMSARKRLLFVNAGAPVEANQDWRQIARATASHTTVCLAEQSSSRLMRHPGLEAILGAVPLQFPATVTAAVDASGPEQVFTGSHDGYLQRLGLIHHRELRLSEDGTALHGIERLETKGGQDRLKRDCPFAVHFHLDPRSHAERSGGSDDAVLITLDDGQVWRFHATGAAISVEESQVFAGHAGPRHSLQVALRGACAGITEIRWYVSLAGDRAGPVSIEPV